MLFAHAWPYDHGVLDEIYIDSASCLPLHFEERSPNLVKSSRLGRENGHPKTSPVFFTSFVIVLSIVLSILPSGNLT